MTIKIKICGIYDSKNLEGVLKLKPDFIGFNFYPESKRYCRLTNINEMDFGNTLKVGVFVNAAISEIVEKAESFGLSLIQLHGFETEDQIKLLRQKLPDLQLIKAIGIEVKEDFENPAMEFGVDYLLYDKKAVSFGGTGLRFDWDLLQGRKANKKFFFWQEA